jgi:hypothetical protein
MIFDNSEGKHNLIAEKIFDSNINILNEIRFNQLKSQ